MESYGEQLRRAREAKGIDYETISNETTISAQYLIGLEQEDSSAFPGEPYMLGFLRNYAEYLGLNSESLLGLYRAKKLQEAPVPEGLIVHEKPAYFWPLVAGGAAVFLAAVIVCICIFVNHKKAENGADVIVDKNSSKKTYELTDKAFSSRVYVGDQFVYHAAQGDIILTVSDTHSTFGLQCPVGTVYTELAEEAELDVDGDAVTDLIVYVSDVSVSEENRGAEVRLLRRTGGNYASSVSHDDIPFATEIVSNHKQIVIFEDNRAYPFTLNGSFRGPCVFRYKVDRHDPVESYFTSGEVVTMTANNGIRLWMSNCNTIKFSIIADSKSYDLEIGKAGQVLVEDIKWIKDTDGKYKLVVIELD